MAAAQVGTKSDQVCARPIAGSSSRSSGLVSAGASQSSPDSDCTSRHWLTGRPRFASTRRAGALPDQRIDSRFGQLDDNLPL